MNKLRLTLIIIVILVIIVHFSFKQPTPESDDPFIGPENAELTIVEFGDYFCPATKQFYTLRFKELRESYPQVKWVYRDFPIGPDIAAQASNCAPDFWEFHEKLMTNFNLSRERLIELSDNNQDFIECLDSEKFKDEVKKDFKDGISLGVEATPTFFINGEKIRGNVDLTKEIDKFL